MRYHRCPPACEPKIDRTSLKTTRSKLLCTSTVMPATANRTPLRSAFFAAGPVASLRGTTRKSRNGVSAVALVALDRADRPSLHAQVWSCFGEIPRRSQYLAAEAPCARHSATRTFHSLAFAMQHKLHGHTSFGRRRFMQRIPFHSLAFPCNINCMVTPVLASMITQKRPKHDHLKSGQRA